MLFPVASTRLLGALLARCLFGLAFACSGRFGLAATLLDAPPQRVHEIDDVRRPRRRFLFRRRQARLLGADELDHRVLVAILELLWFELARHAIDDLLGETHHLIRQHHVRDLFEDTLLAPDLVSVVQRRAHDALAERLEHHHALTPRHHDTPDTHHLLLVHGV